MNPVGVDPDLDPTFKKKTGSDLISPLTFFFRPGSHYNGYIIGIAQSRLSDPGVELTPDLDPTFQKITGSEPEKKQNKDPDVKLQINRTKFRPSRKAGYESSTRIRNSGMYSVGRISLHFKFALKALYLELYPSVNKGKKNLCNIFGFIIEDYHT